MTVNDGWLISRVRATHRGNGLFVKGVVTLRWPAAFSSLTHVICIVCISVVFLRILLALQLFPNPGPRTLLLPQVTQNEQLFAAPQDRGQGQQNGREREKNDRKTPSFLMKKRHIN